MSILDFLCNFLKTTNHIVLKLSPFAIADNISYHCFSFEIVSDTHLCIFILLVAFAFVDFKLGMVQKVHGVDAQCFLLGLVVRSSLLVPLMWQMRMQKECSNEWLGTLLSGTDRHVLVCLYETY